MRRAAPVLLAVAVAAVVVIGLIQASGGSEAPKRAPAYDLDRALAKLDGAPLPLADLHEQSAALLGGGVPAFRARVRALRGHPVVVNKWGSWCTPCRRELPYFARAGTDYGKRVAFLGLNGQDNADNARAFLRDLPLPFPSYADERETIARKYGVPANYPITLFLDARGKTTFVKQGEYRTYADLEADIERYL